MVNWRVILSKIISVGTKDGLNIETIIFNHLHMSSKLFIHQNFKFVSRSA